MILALAGEDPENVIATGGNYLHKKIADVTTTLMEFPSGLRAHIFVSWLHPFKEQKLVVVGDRKMAVFDDTRAWNDKLLLYPHKISWKDNMPIPNKAEGEHVDISESEPLRSECEHFLECIATGQIPRTDGREGLRNVFIGRGTKIWHFSHILSGTHIGKNCNVGQNVVIGPDVTVGNNCKIQNNVSIYKGVTLEHGVFCGPSMVFTNVHNPRAEIRKMDQVRSTLVKKGATIGANATIICGNEIGLCEIKGV